MMKKITFCHITPVDCAIFSGGRIRRTLWFLNVFDKNNIAEIPYENYEHTHIKIIRAAISHLVYTFWFKLLPKCHLFYIGFKCGTLRWRHNDHAGVSNHQPPGCLLNRLFRRKSKKTSKLRVTGLCAGNSPGTGEFSAQMASYAENVSIWWRHHEFRKSDVLSTVSHDCVIQI